MRSCQQGFPEVAPCPTTAAAHTAGGEVAPAPPQQPPAPAPPQQQRPLTAAAHRATPAHLLLVLSRLRGPRYACCSVPAPRGTSEMFPGAALSSERVASNSKAGALPLWRSVLHSGEGAPSRVGGQFLFANIDTCGTTPCSHASSRSLLPCLVMRREHAGKGQPKLRSPVEHTASRINNVHCHTNW